MIPLCITARTRGALVLPPDEPWPLMLDGLLAWAVTQLHDRRQHLVDCQPTGPIDCTHGKRRRRSSGQQIQGEPVRYTPAASRHMIVRSDRFGRRLASSNDDLQSRRYVPREYRLPLAHAGDWATGDQWWWQASSVSVEGQTATWWAVGDPERVERLLDQVEGLTAVKRAWTPVTRWSVVEDDLAGDLYDVARRPIPAPAGYQGPTVSHGIRPPYWHPAQVRPCLTR